MPDRKFLKLMQRYEVNLSVGGSTLRNQGAPGVTEAARNFLVKFDLSPLKTIESSAYSKALGKWTSKLKEALPKKAQNWGTARKAINIFMVHVFLNKYLSKEYGMEKFKDVLETPLDSYAAKGLRRFSKNELPEWKSIKGLKEKDSRKYQQYALEMAKENKLPRVCLDIMLWRAGKDKNKENQYDPLTTH